MTANTVFKIADLDFDQIKSNLKDYLRSQNTFQDYDFDGSGMSILLDVLAYNTHYMAYYLNMVANEAFLDSAQIRDSLISRAKELGYTPTSRRASMSNVSIVVTPPNGNNSSQITIPKNTLFQSEAVDGVNYTFVNLDSYSAVKNVTSNTFTFPVVILYQGEPLTATFTVDTSSSRNRYIIPSSNIDTTTLVVSVQQSTLNTATDTYTRHSDLTRLDANSTVYFLEGAPNDKYALYFGDGYLGKQLSNGNLIIATYISTEGQAANKANNFTPQSTIYGFSNITVTHPQRLPLAVLT
jgi:hypothetical protein